MVTNIFKKKASKQAVVNTAPVAVALPNDENALRARAERRENVDFAALSLDVRSQTKSGYYERSFISLAKQHAHHEFLIKQLLHGAAIDVGNRLVAYQTHQECYYGIEEFIDFLNSEDQPHHKEIRYVADVDFQTTRNFSAYFLQRFPGRTVNRKRYGRVRTLIDILQRKYGHNSYVGEPIAWAQAPFSNEVPSESYPDEIFNQLVEACMTDIRFVMKMMTTYPDRLREAKESAIKLQYKVQKSGVITGASRDETNLICSALTSAAFPNWPFFEPFEKASDILSVEWNGRLGLADKDRRNLYRIITRMRISLDVKFQSSGETRNIDLEVGKEAYLCQFFFTLQTIYPFILFVQINSGWNLEAVLNLTDDLDGHLQEDLVDPDQYVVICSTKERTKDVPVCRSNKVHPYSVYNILRFIQDRLSPFKRSMHYRPGFMWQAMMSKNLWNKYNQIVISADEKNVRAASVAFLKRHGIEIDNKAKSPGIESRRIRTTWETKRKEQGVPIESISEWMGHENIDTTAINYDSDSGSSNLRNKKLRQLQAKWDDDFRNYEVKLSVSTSLTQLRESIGNPRRLNILSKASSELGIDEKAIVHLLSPSGQTYIVACLDAKSPSWPNAARFVSSGESCSYFNRCCMCKQAVLFKESLPFVVRRVADLNKLKERINSFEWSSNYGEEATAWEQILEQWKPKSDVEEARKSATDPQYTLPLAMRGV